MTIDEKIKELRRLTSTFPFIEYYSHLDGDCYKIINPYSAYKEDKIVLCLVEEGFETALNKAIQYFKKF